MVEVLHNFRNLHFASTEISDILKIYGFLAQFWMIVEIVLQTRIHYLPRLTLSCIENDSLVFDLILGNNDNSCYYVQGANVSCLGAQKLLAFDPG